jgi:3-hydroxyisobutyrate dehydrogenase
MGTGFVRRLLKNGHQVNVWNRTSDKAKALEADGARAFPDVASAVKGVERIHLSLADDASVDAAIEPVAQLIAATTVIIDHTTTAPTTTKERVARWAKRGRVFLHAPVFMSPPNTAEGTGYMLISGDPTQCAAVMPDLEKMATKVVNLGSKPGMAASYKLFGNLALIAMTGIAGDIVRLAAAVGLEPEEAVGLFKYFNPGEMLPARAEKVAAGPYQPPSFTIAMARKDVRLMQEEADRQNVKLALIPGIAALQDEAIARGEGSLDTTAGFRYPIK